MNRKLGTLREELEWIDGKTRIYLGTRKGSGFFFIGTKHELGDEYEDVLDRKVVDVYKKTFFTEESGIAMIVNGGSVRGNYWFHDEFVENNMAIRPFDPYAEYQAKRYKYDESLGFGKFNRPYYEPKFDLFGSQIAMASFRDSDIPRIEHLLPRGSYVPRTDQLEAWNVKRVGKEWDKHPDAMLKAYGVDRYGDIDSNKFTALGKKVYLASSEKSIATEGWRYLMIDSHRATFCNRGHAECLFVPVFFNEESLLGY